MNDQTKSGTDLAADERIRILAAELGVTAEEGSNAPPIMVASDGSPAGTIRMFAVSTFASSSVSIVRR